MPPASRTATRWLNASEMTAWRNFAETIDDLITALEADLAPSGLTLGDYQVLVYLSEQDHGQMRMCDLASLLQLSPSGLTRRLDGLVADGLVTRLPSPDDGRAMLATLTDRGRRTLEQAAPGHVNSVRARIIDRLDDAEVAAMGHIFAAIRLGLDEEQP